MNIGEENMRKGPWYEEEDERLRTFVAVLGERRWDSIARASGLKRSGKSCRLRWLNYLRPCLKQGPITPEEELVILQLHEKWGNKWAKIARKLPGRTDNEIKNYWRTHLRKKMQIQNAILHHSPFPNSNNVSSAETPSSSDETSISNQDVSSQEGDTIPREISSNNNNNEAFVGPHYDTNPKGLSDYDTITSSPYENRLSDWITTLSSQHSDDLSPACWQSNGLELGFDHYPIITWSPEDTSVWDCPDTLWDINLFTINSEALEEKSSR